MKATGIVRRIDELGRVVIPKEIRRTLHIREGYPLEIFVGKDAEIVLKKYSPLGEMGDSAGDYAQVLHRVSGHTALIADRDVIVSAAGNAARRLLLDRPVSAEVEELLNARRMVSLTENDGALPPLCEGAQEDYHAAVIAPILSEGELIGMVALVSQKEDMTLTDQKLAESAALFLGSQMEN